MTTFEAKGRMMSTFRPPTDAEGKSMTARDWLQKSVVRRFESGESLESIEANLAQQVGVSVVWHGDSSHFAESVRIAIGALRKAAGIVDPRNWPTLREPP